MCTHFIIIVVAVAAVAVAVCFAALLPRFVLKLLLAAAFGARH